VSTHILTASYKEKTKVVDGEDPQHWRSIVSGTLFILGLLIIIVSAGSLLMDPQTLPVKKVRVEGDFRRLSPESLQTTVTEVVRGGFFNVNVEIIKESLFQNPWVYQVTVRRIWPDTLSVKVIEQTAVARWGEQGLINSQAEFFAPSKQTFPKNLPVLMGPVDSYALLLGQYVRIRDALAARRLQVSGLTLNDRRAWQFELVKGPSVILGRQDVDRRVARFTDYVTTRLANRLSQIKLIDMRYTNGFAVQWQQTSSGTVESGQENHG